jgi:hypothetical protein
MYAHDEVPGTRGSAASDLHAGSQYQPASRARRYGVRDPGSGRVVRRTALPYGSFNLPWQATCW